MAEVHFHNNLQKTSVLAESAPPIPHAWIGLRDFDYNLYILSIMSKALNSNLVTSISLKVRKCKSYIKNKQMKAKAIHKSS